MAAEARGIESNIDRSATADEVTERNFRYQAQIVANLAYLLNSHLNTYSIRRNDKLQGKISNCIVDIENVLYDIKQSIDEDERKAWYE
jgi:hypothetical protein